MKKLSVFFILLACFAQPVAPTRAAKSLTVIITQAQLDAVIDSLPNRARLQLIKNIDGTPQELLVAILPGRFAITFRIQQSRSSGPDYYYVVLLPTLQNGKITCTVDRIWLKDKWLTRNDLGKPNPYIATTNADATCEMFLSPFLVGYGPGAMIARFSAGYADLTVEIGGNLLPGAPPPAVVAGCEVYWWHSIGYLHSTPDWNSPFLGTVSDEARVLAWKHFWLKVETDSGTVGWVYPEWAIGDARCIGRAGNGNPIWVVLDSSDY